MQVKNCSGQWLKRWLALLVVTGIASVSAQAQNATNGPSGTKATDATALVPGQFVDITAKSGIKVLHQAPHTSRKYLIETMGSGVALFDCDNDSRLDIYFVNGAPYSDPTPKGFIPQKTGPEYWNRMYHQKPDGTFEDVTEKAGLQGVGYGMGVAVGDYDNDGFEDLYVTGYGGNRLYHNNGNCTFTDVTEKAGVSGSGWSSSATWVDLDNDGLLDLVVDRYVEWDWNDQWCGEHREGYRGYCHPDVFQAISMLVYHNDGNGHFSEVSHKLGLDKPAKALGIAIADYDQDGRIDLFVANDSMQEFLFHQKKDGTFEEVGLESGAAVNADGQTYAGMGVDFADYNNDGWPDLVITDLANQRYALYQNARDGTFNYTSFSSGVGDMSRLHSGWSLRFIDYDNDGWKDLLIAQGHDLDTIEKSFPLLRYKEPVMLLRNTGKRFVDVSGISSEIFHEAWVGRGMAIGDLDNDGRIDAVVTTNGGPAHVLLNQTATKNHWINLRLVGHKSNRDGIGAQVKITTALGDQWSEVTTSSGYMSASDRRLHFGLGAEQLIQRIEIRWPSGIKQVLINTKGDEFLTIDEPDQSGTAQSSSVEPMEFADKVSFSVAGVTDWTAVGGHGSDSSLRTSEELARETLALKPKAAPRSATDSAGEGREGNESENALRASLASAPSSFKANHELGECYIHEGKNKEAIPLLQRAFQIDPSNHENEYELALALTEAGDLPQAQKHAHTLLAHEASANTLRLAGSLDEKLGDSLTAVHELEQAVRLVPSEPNVFEWGSELLLHRAVWQAQEVFEKGAATYPKSARMLTALGAALFAGARYDEAARRLCDASDLNPADSEPYVFMGKIEVAAPNPLACVEQKLRRFAEEQPDNALANYFYAMAILKQREQSADGHPTLQAETLLTKAVAIDQKCSEAYLQLGILSFSRHDLGQAIGFYTMAIEANPQSSEAHYRLGVAYDRTGQAEKAKREFQLHDEMKRQEAEAIEHQRRDVKQFLVVVQGKPTHPPAN